MRGNCWIYREEGFEEHLGRISHDAAEERAKALLHDGWDSEIPSGGSVSGWIILHDDNGDEIESHEVFVQIAINHEALIQQAVSHNSECLDCKHEWTSKGEGGLIENPGFSALSGTALRDREHCSLCGLQKETITQDSNEPNNRNGTKYLAPGEDWSTGG